MRAVEADQLENVLFSSTAPYLPATPCVIVLLLNLPSSYEGNVWFLVPTGALIVIVVYYSRPQRKPLFEISSISANIFSFSF